MFSRKDAYVLAKGCLARELNDCEKRTLKCVLEEIKLASSTGAMSCEVTLKKEGREDVNIHVLRSRLRRLGFQVIIYNIKDVYSNWRVAVSWQ